MHHVFVSCVAARGTNAFAHARQSSGSFLSIRITGVPSRNRDGSFPLPKAVEGTKATCSQKAPILLVRARVTIPWCLFSVCVQNPTNEPFLPQPSALSLICESFPLCLAGHASRRLLSKGRYQPGAYMGKPKELAHTLALPLEECPGEFHSVQQ